MAWLDEEAIAGDKVRRLNSPHAENAVGFCAIPTKRAAASDLRFKSDRVVFDLMTRDEAVLIQQCRDGAEGYIAWRDGFVNDVAHHRPRPVVSIVAGETPEDSGKIRRIGRRALDGGASIERVYACHILAP